MNWYIPRIINNYEFTDLLLGKGAFAIVKSAVHIPTKETVAIKIIPKSLIRENPQLIMQLNREVQALTQCDHPFIVKFFDFFEDKHFFYIVQEYVNHGTLLESVNARGHLTEKQCRKYFCQILSAICYLHNKNILHRDLKAENILLDSGDNIRLVDFGLCKTFEQNEDKYTSTLCGSFTYAAPEIIQGKKYSLSADVWALGVLLYAISNCQLPWEDENNKKLCQKIMYTEPNYPSSFSPSLIDLLSKMLKKNPEERITIKEIQCHPWVAQNSCIPNALQQFNNIEILNKLESLGFSKEEVIRNLKEGKRISETISFEILRRSKMTELLNDKNTLQPPFKALKSLSDRTINTQLPILNLNKPCCRLSVPTARRLSTAEIRDAGTASNAALKFSRLLNLQKKRPNRNPFIAHSLASYE